MYKCIETIDIYNRKKKNRKKQSLIVFTFKDKEMFFALMSRERGKQTDRRADKVTQYFVFSLHICNATGMPKLMAAQ